ncbi:MAG: sigma-54 dependent transcriptional regulator [Proteobacteria bacterium]|nr:sigma-54 dependent transcriptional regulator [Pseudomonadota bacterium]MBU1688703.1 sigma-54 dependent transcriptional regulator [Pseudomonadota bacterium]
MSQRILLIDDDDSLRRVTEYNLSASGFEVTTAASGSEGLGYFHKSQPDLVVTDVELGDMNGLDILARIREEAPEVPVIVITAYGTIDMAVKAMGKGAFNFITKPFDRETLRVSCLKGLEMRALKSQNLLLTEEVDRLTGVEGMETANPAMAELLGVALRVAESEATVLITGESGTGKEVLARLIHGRSGRKKGPMVAVNCAAIPENLIESELFGHLKGSFTGAVANRKGRFQTASGGTLFLDEIGELPMEMQAKLLRVIQEKEVEAVGADRPEKVDVRIVAATNRDLKQMTADGTFREDLYYRLGVILLHIPALRERSEDIEGLAIHFLKKLQAPRGVSFSLQALARMKAYPWPGNIRELQNAVERGYILRREDAITEYDLGLPGLAKNNTPTGDDGALSLEIPDEGISLEEVERELIRKAMAKSGGNRSEAARLLKIPRHVLIYRLEKYAEVPKQK